MKTAAPKNRRFCWLPWWEFLIMQPLCVSIRKEKTGKAKAEEEQDRESNIYHYSLHCRLTLRFDIE